MFETKKPSCRCDTIHFQGTLVTKLGWYHNYHFKKATHWSDCMFKTHLATKLERPNVSWKTAINPNLQNPFKFRIGPSLISWLLRNVQLKLVIREKKVPLRIWKKFWEMKNQHLKMTVNRTIQFMTIRPNDIRSKVILAVKAFVQKARQCLDKEKAPILVKRWSCKEQ